MKVKSWSVYLVTDPVLKSPGLDVVQIVERACAAGVSLVQYRDKECSREEFIQTGRRLCAVTARHGVPFIINDRVDTVMELGADGVHVGQDDMNVEQVRRLVGPEAIVGVSVSCVDEAIRAEEAGATYVAVNGVFPTGTKFFDRGGALGLDVVSQVSRAVEIPVIGIGGINVFNAARVIQAGAAGVAVVTAITMRPDIEDSVAELLIETKR